MTLDHLRLLGDRNVLALTLDGEGEGEPIEGIVAIGCVIRTRLRKNPTRFGISWIDVCLKPNQFSCWLEAGGAADFARIMARAQAIDEGQTPSDAPFRQCLFVASGIISGELIDNVSGATHYVTETLASSPTAPTWVKQSAVLARRGHHVFMRA